MPKPIPEHIQALLNIYPGKFDAYWYRKYIVLISERSITVMGENKAWTFTALETAKLAKQVSENLMKLSKKNRKLLAGKAVEEYKSFTSLGDGKNKPIFQQFDPNL